MSYQMNPAQFKQVVALPAQQRYEHFISKVADWQELWTLKGPDGFVMFGDSLKQESLPLWPHPDYAVALVKNSWSDCSPEMLELDAFMSRWIPGIIRDNRMIAVFPTPQEKGIVIAPQVLQADLSNELKQYE